MFSQAVADAICVQIAEGKSLRDICEADGMPSRSAVFRWLADPEREAFRNQYAQAREDQADTIFEEILTIADDARNDWMERRGEEDAGWQANGEHIQRSRLRVDARKWMAGKLRPKVYGDKITQEHTGGLTITLASDAEKL